MQHVTVDSIQRAGLMQIHTFMACLGPSPTRVIITLADRDSPSAVGHVGQLKAQHLARPQPAVKNTGSLCARRLRNLRTLSTSP